MDVIFVSDMAALDNSAQIQQCFEDLKVPFHREADKRGVPMFYCLAEGAERVSDELDERDQPHE